MTEPVGAWLKQWREERGMSRRDVARWSGFDLSYISRIEAGTRVASLATLLRLADAMDLKPSQRARLVVSTIPEAERREVRRYLTWMGSVKRMDENGGDGGRSDSGVA